MDTRIKPVTEEAAAFLHTSSRRCWSSACSVVNSVCLCSSSTRFTAVCAPSGRCLRSGRASVCLCAVCWRVEESSRWRKLKRLDSLRYERHTCHLQPPWHHCVALSGAPRVFVLSDCLFKVWWFTSILQQERKAWFKMRREQICLSLNSSRQFFVWFLRWCCSDESQNTCLRNVFAWLHLRECFQEHFHLSFLWPSRLNAVGSRKATRSPQ